MTENGLVYDMRKDRLCLRLDSFLKINLIDLAYLQQNSSTSLAFNMGMRMVLVVDKEAAIRILKGWRGTNSMHCIGEVVSGERVSYQ